jgi:putative cardiolipin synthase
VRLLTNSLASTDVPVVHAGYANIRSRLLAEGVEVHEMRPTAMAGQPPAWRITGSSSASLHTKAIIVDRQRVLVGSMNLDPRSRQGNTEVAVQIESVALGEQIARLFDTAMIPARAFRVRLAAHPASAGALTWDAEDDGRAVQYDAEPASLWRRILARVLGWLVPEYLL